MYGFLGKLQQAFHHSIAQAFQQQDRKPFEYHRLAVKDSDRLQLQCGELKGNRLFSRQ